jgi:hypothetical protein
MDPDRLRAGHDSLDEAKAAFRKEDGVACKCHGRLLERDQMRKSQSGKRSPNIGSPLTDWALVASS